MVRIGAGWQRVALAVGLLAILSGGAEGPPAADASGGGANPGLIDAAVHMIKIGRFDEAAAALKQIMASNPTPAEALRLRNRAGYDFLAPLIHHPKVGGPVKELLGLAFEAIKANRTNPEYIAQMIGLLGTIQEIQAVEHLRSCGPYAIQPLIEALQDPQRGAKHAAVETVLTRMPAEAAPAMIEALRCPDPAVQAALADALGQMSSRLALHRLKRLAENPQLAQTVRVRVESAIRSILGRRAWSVKPAVEYSFELALALHHGEAWALPPGASARAPLWRWDEKQKRLTSTEVARTQYGPLMAERTAERLVADWPRYEPAYPIWYLAKLGTLWEAQARPDPALDAEAVAREIRILGSLLGDRRLSAGLSAALDRKDYPAALGFLRGLEAVAGPRTVRVEPAIAKALSAPDRAVRYQAALTIAAADPDAPFPGSDLVVPMLAEALHQTARPEIVVAFSDQQVVNRFRSVLRTAGYLIRDVRTSREALGLVGEAASAELVMLDAKLTDPPADVFLRQMRSGQRTRRLPVVLVARNEAEQAGLETGLAVRYPHVTVVRETAPPDVLRQQVAAVIATTRGRPLTAEEADDFGRRAADALIEIEMSHPAFRLPAAVPHVKAVLLTGSQDVRVTACRLLSRVGNAECQRALAEAALQEDAPPAVVQASLEGLVAATRRHGSGLDLKQVTGIVSLLDTGDPALTDLATRLMGMTGLRAEDVAKAYRRAGGR